MTKTGNLSKRERETVLKAAQIVDAWVKAQTEQGRNKETDFTVRELDYAAFQLKELLFETR